MTFDEFYAEAERLGMEAIDDPNGDEGPEWLACDGARIVVRYDVVGEAFFLFDHGTPSDALREASRLMRGDVAGKLREWLGGCIGLAAKNDDAALGVLMTVLAKLDELEGVR